MALPVTVTWFRVSAPALRMPPPLPPGQPAPMWLPAPNSLHTPLVTPLAPSIDLPPVTSSDSSASVPLEVTSKTRSGCFASMIVKHSPSPTSFIEAVTFSSPESV